jgi:hypothetical protein
MHGKRTPVPHPGMKILHRAKWQCAEHISESSNSAKKCMNSARTGTPRLDGRCAVAGCHTAAPWWRHRESPWRIHAHRSSYYHSRYPGPERGRIEFGRDRIGDGKRAHEFCSCAGARLRLALRLHAQHHALVAGSAGRQLAGLRGAPAIGGIRRGIVRPGPPVRPRLPSLGCLPSAPSSWPFVVLPSCRALSPFLPPLVTFPAARTCARGATAAVRLRRISRRDAMRLSGRCEGYR